MNVLPNPLSDANLSKRPKLQTVCIGHGDGSTHRSGVPCVSSNGINTLQLLLQRLELVFTISRQHNCCRDLRAAATALEDVQAVGEGCTNAASGTKDEGDCRPAHRAGLSCYSEVSYNALASRPVSG